MTKYVLAGGSDVRYPDYGKRLGEVIKREVAKPRFLSCFFSQPKEVRTQKHDKWESWFLQSAGIELEIVRADEATFIEQVRDCDVVYLHGGRTQRLLEALPDITALRRAFENKIIIGSSAGANFLASVSYSPSKNTTQQGAGLLNIGVVVHYGMEAFEDKHYSMELWHGAARQVKNAIDNAPLILLPEGNFTVIEA